MDDNELELENIKITNQRGTDALRAIFLLNGGASIALLTFLGSIAIGSNNGKLQTSAVAGILLFFSLGACLCVVAYGLDYINLLMHKLGYPKLGNSALVLTVISAMGSIVLFLLGVWKASNVFGAI